MYSQGGMTESPRPLSPGANQAGQDAALARQRSPAQQQHFRQPDQAASGLSLPAHGMSPRTKQAWLSQYPPADRYATEGATAPITTSPTQAAARSRGRAASGANAGHVANGIPAENAGTFVNNEHNVWAYVQQLEARMKQMVDEIEALKKDNTHLREKLTEHEHHFAALANEVAVLRRPAQAQAPQPHHHQQNAPQQQAEAQPQPQPETQLLQPQQPQPPAEQHQPQQEVQVQEQLQAHTQPLAAPAIAAPVAQP